MKEKLRSLAECFDPEVIARGETYFANGWVDISSLNNHRVKANVRGTRNYIVKLNYLPDEDDFDYRCNCPYDMGPCKHIWAALLAAEQENWPPLTGDNHFDDDADIDQREHDIPIIPIETPRNLGARSTQKKSAGTPSQWQRQLDQVADQMFTSYGIPAPPPAPPAQWPAAREVCYVISPDSTWGGDSHLEVDILARDALKSGKLGKWKRGKPANEEWAGAPQEDRLIAQMLAGCGARFGYARSEGPFTIGNNASAWLLERICRTGRCHLLDVNANQPGESIAWDDGDAWGFDLEIRWSTNGQFEASGVLTRGDQVLRTSETNFITRRGWVVARGKLARFDHRGAYPLLDSLSRTGPLRVDRSALPKLLEKLCELPNLPNIRLPAEIEIEQREMSPQPTLTLRPDRKSDKLTGELKFQYGDVKVSTRDNAAAIVLHDPPRLIRRDKAAELAAKNLLRSLKFRTDWTWYGPRSAADKWIIDRPMLSNAVATLIAHGWHVDAEGKIFRSGGTIKIEVKSGIDWFDLNARVEFDQTSVSFPKLLAALRKGERTVILDDGTVGLLPEEWLHKYAPIANLGEEKGDAIRFVPAQAGLLDAMLATLPEARCDDAFCRVREKLNSFAGVVPLDPPKNFIGTLRDYQRDGLGWLDFLRSLSLGGCLADDMGLGKTIQILAMLEQRRAEKTGPSLAVVPRSLIFNWTNEAARFTPKLRVLDLSSLGQLRGEFDFAHADLVLTTYGVLRRNITRFRETEFDYVILDESQAIKNATTQSAKAVRLLRGRHRLALSGTPIENHLGELWSLFEFLNPGMLGTASVFKELIRSDGQVEKTGAALLSRALRPFILRRTKSQVARELPDKVEQTLVCELETEQRKLYDELKSHYRESLLGRIEKEGIERSKMHVLEALLRLRQAACHPGLIDASRRNEPSAKLAALLANLTEVTAEGHKVLVFSQFTSLLAIVRDALDKQKLTYEYLDGQTRDRQGRVQRFQTDPACPIFLISLKAGGVGLNLTAAEYVFLLDPWWNPAIEAQAIDRAHRIGQQRTVFSYRLIARDTVEEKILQLQQTKRDLADAIITQDNSLISRMGVEELRTLLS